MTLDCNQDAYRRIQIVVPGARHLFEEPGTLEQAADHARRWFVRHLDPVGRPQAGAAQALH
jgi:putative phosphoribosyl transferase